MWRFSSSVEWCSWSCLGLHGEGRHVGCGADVSRLNQHFCCHWIRRCAFGCRVCEGERGLLLVIVESWSWSELDEEITGYLSFASWSGEMLRLEPVVGASLARLTWPSVREDTQPPQVPLPNLNLLSLPRLQRFFFVM